MANLHSRVGAFPIVRDLHAQHHDALVSDLAGAVAIAVDIVREAVLVGAHAIHVGHTNDVNWLGVSR
jgi:hypothetical protein